MTVGELIAELSQYDLDRMVIIRKDREGNDHSPLDFVYTGAYVADSTWSGNVGLEELTEEDIEDGYTEEDVFEGVRALVLVPVN